jgi:hypothetical protein
MWVTVLSEEELKAILDSPVWHRVSFLPSYADYCQSLSMLQYHNYMHIWTTTWTGLINSNRNLQRKKGGIEAVIEISKPTQLKISGTTTIWASRCIKPPTLGVHISGYEKCNLQNWTILTTTHDSACRYFLLTCQNVMDFLFLLLICCDCLQGGNIMFLNLKPFISVFDNKARSTQELLQDAQTFCVIEKKNSCKTLSMMYTCNA